jgi:hypothetical protein
MRVKVCKLTSKMFPKIIFDSTVRTDGLLEKCFVMINTSCDDIPREYTVSRGWKSGKKGQNRSQKLTKLTKKRKNSPKMPKTAAAK